MALIRTIFFLIIFYYLFKFIGKLVAPYLLAKGMEKMKNQQHKQQNFRESKKREEGKITIQKKQETTKKTSSDLGDYVEYEEVK